MLFSPVLAKIQSAPTARLSPSSAARFSSFTSLTSSTSHYPSKPFRMNTCKSSSKKPPLTIFRINTCKSVSKQRALTLCRINTYRKPGRGYPHLLQLRQRPSHAPRGASIPCGFIRLRILPVTTGVHTPNARSAFVANSSGSPFVITKIQIPFPSTPLFSHPSKSLGVWGHSDRNHASTCSL